MFRVKFFTFLAIVFLPILISSCGNQKVYLLSEDEYLLLPIKVSEFTGFLDKVGIKVQAEHAKDEIFLKLLNISGFNAIIVDNFTFTYLKRLDPSWVKLCTVAVKEPAIFLLTRNSPVNKLYTINLPIYKEILRRNRIDFMSVKEFNKLIEKNYIAYLKPIKGFRIVKALSSAEFFLCVKLNLLSNHPGVVSSLMKSWEEGLTYIKDEAVFEYFLDRTGIRQDKTIKFRSCFRE